MCYKQCFKWLVVYSQVEHDVKPSKISLNEW